MHTQNHWLPKIIFAIFLSLCVSLVSGHKDMTLSRVDAGDHQFAHVGDKDSKDIKYRKNENKEHDDDSDKHHHNKYVRHHDEIVIDAGDDQVVNAGDKVRLKGIIKYTQNKGNGHKNKEKHHKHDSDNNHHKKHVKYDKHHHKKDGKHHDDFDGFVIRWSQDEGIPVDLIRSNRLKTKFVAPTPSVPGEILVFTLTVSNRHGKVIGSDSVNVTVQGSVSTTSTISGRITAVDGSELPDISINILQGSTPVTSETSGANGDFSVNLPANMDFVLALSGNGYADQVVPVRSPEPQGSLFLDITMIMRSVAQTFNTMDLEALISGADGASVWVYPEDFVDKNGVPVSGNIEVTITPVDVSRQAYLGAFPGEFSGMLEGETVASPFYSLGAVEFEFSQDGQPVQLAEGATADIWIPIYFPNYLDGTPIEYEDGIPIWSLNEETGIWEQESWGTVTNESPGSTRSPTGLYLLAEVSHFSWWNCDVSMNAAQAYVTVNSPDTGTALIKARTNAEIGWRPNTVETVTQVNMQTPPLYIPSNGEVCFWAEVNFDNGQSGSTPQNCITATPGATVEVELSLSEAGPVDLITIPAATADMLDVVAYPGFAVDRVQLLPSTLETAVSYTIISGALPAGLSLNTVNATRAEITGVTNETEPGMFSVVIEARDSDDYTDTVTINYDVKGGLPPVLEPEIFISYYSSNDPGTVFTFDMNDYNTGDPATYWSLTYDPSHINEGSMISLDPATGILTIIGECVFIWDDGRLKAGNANGTSTAIFGVGDSRCN